MFLVSRKDFGRIKVGKTVTAYFDYEPGTRITQMVSVCECSVPTNEVQNNRIKVTFHPNDIPAHLIALGKTEYIANKQIWIDYVDKKSGLTQKAELIISATVTKL